MPRRREVRIARVPHSGWVSGRGRNPHCGLTLIELLIVMTILVLLVGAAIPVMSPSNDGRRIREATRGLNAYLAGAQARAVKSGRPFGVTLKKLSQDTGDADDNGVCLELFYVEQPAPFAGFDRVSRVMIGTGETRVGANADIASPDRFIVRFVRLDNSVAPNADGLPNGVDPDLPPPGLFRRGDRIEVGGHMYVFSDDTADVDPQGFYLPIAGTPDGTLRVEPVVRTRPALQFVFDNEGDRLRDAQPAGSQGTPNPFWTEPLTYKIHRQPVRTSAPPYQLPEGTAIDLRASGTAIDPLSAVTDAPVFYNIDAGLTNKISNPDPVMIMFAPEGSVSTLTTSVDEPNGNDNDDNNDNPDLPLQFEVTSDIYLLVGKRENIPAPDPTVEPDLNFATPGRTDAELQEARAKINWLGGEARWVTIGARTGAVITSPVAFVDAGEIAREPQFANLSQIRNQEIYRSREFAISKSSAGGR